MLLSYFNDTNFYINKKPLYLLQNKNNQETMNPASVLEIYEL